KNLIKEPSNSSTEITIQESAQNSSFDVEENSALPINNQISNDSGDLISKLSSLKEKKESIQHANSLSDEYSNSDEENDEQNFDTALTLMYKAKEKVNDERASSNLPEDSSLQSINKALDQSLVTNNVQENTSNKVNELTAEDKCVEMVDIQMSQQNNINDTLSILLSNNNQNNLSDVLIDSPIVQNQNNSSSNKKEKERMEYTSSESSDDEHEPISLNTNIAAKESQASDRLQNSNKVVNLLQTSNDLEFGEEIEYEHANANQ
ncbi:6268_t:CDS:2, partial [Gigaspora margarita]